MWYLFKKYIYAVDKCDEVPEILQVTHENLSVELSKFLKTTRLEPVFIIYPDKAEEINPELRKKKFAPYLLFLSGKGAKHVVQVADDSRWNSSLYRDNIHPIVEGYRVLAKIIADSISQHR